MKYIQKDIHYSITKKEQGILKIRRKYNNLSGCLVIYLHNILRILEVPKNIGT